MISREEEHPELKGFLEDVFAGRRIRLWSQYRRQKNWIVPSSDTFRSAADSRRFARRWGRFIREAPGLAVKAANRKPIVKCIWANLMLRWLIRHCNCRVILVVRHPAAVIESEIRNGWDAGDTLDRFRQDRKLQELTEGRYCQLLAGSLTAVEALTLRWLIENQPMIDAAPSRHLSIVYYEQLAASSTFAWRQVKDALILERSPDSEVLARPSQQSWPPGAAASQRHGAKPTWQRMLTPEQSDEIQGVLDRCEFHLYSMRDSEPRVRQDDAQTRATRASS